MNFFEDLIDELKDEDLLEQTVIEKSDADLRSSESQPAESSADVPVETDPPTGVIELDSFEPASAPQHRPEPLLPALDLDGFDPQINAALDNDVAEVAAKIDVAVQSPTGENISDNASVERQQPCLDEIAETERFLQQLEAEELKRQVSAEVSAHISRAEPAIARDSEPDTLPEAATATDGPESAPVLTETEYYRKRAMEEVAALQMVDNIFSNVEREQMKVMPNPYDDFEVKKALHSFMQVSGDINSPEHAQAEFRLMQNTESWYSALAARDQRISVENLRYCCETTRPPLSAPALLALARYYRNSIFNEAVRNKFDLLATRLFSTDQEFGKRDFLFSRAELTAHLTELFVDWESLPLGEDAEPEELAAMVSRFDEVIAEAAAATCFGDLIKSDFFKRFRAIKQETKESFYEPMVAAAAIECNINVGNRYLELIEKEHHSSEAGELQEKYGMLHDNLVSNATSKTVQLADLLEQLQKRPKPPEFDVTGWEYISDAKLKGGEPGAKRSKGKYGWLFGVNKYLLAAAIVTVVLTAGLYLWVENSDTPLDGSANVVQLDMSGLDFKEYVTAARISNEALFVISSPRWSSASKEKREEVVMKMVSAGRNRGYKKVHVLDERGMVVAAGTEQSIEVK